MSDSNSNNSGAGVAGMLGVLFVGLKLGGVIGWSWWYVTLPFWGGAALVLTVGCGYLLMVGAGTATMKIGRAVSNNAQHRKDFKLLVARVADEREAYEAHKLLEDPYMQIGLAEVKEMELDA